MKYIFFLIIFFSIEKSYTQIRGEFRLAVEGHFDKSPNSYGPKFLLSITNLNDSLVEIPSTYSAAPINSYSDITYEIFEIKGKNTITLNIPPHLINKQGSERSKIQLDVEESLLFFVEISSSYNYFYPGKKYLIKFFLKELNLKADYLYTHK